MRGVKPAQGEVLKFTFAGFDPAILFAFPLRRRGLDRQRVNPLLQLIGQSGIHHPVLLNARLAAEGVRHDHHAEMALPIGACAGMAGVVVGLVDDLERRRRETLHELCGDSLAHGAQRR